MRVLPRAPGPTGRRGLAAAADPDDLGRRRRNGWRRRAGLHRGRRGGGDPANLQSVPVVQYRLKRITVYQVTALLMVNGKLELAKQWAEKDESYAN